MSSAIYWMRGPWRGRLGIAARPRGGDWLADEIRGWQGERIAAIVSLLTPEEERELLLTEESAQARAHGINFVSLPVPDRQVPERESDVDASVQELDSVLASGRNVLVHCRQGIGRSSLLAAALLINRGDDPETALNAVSAARGVAVPETAEQREWIERYASHVRIH